MSVRKRGGIWQYEFWIEGQRYSGSFNGKNGKPLAATKREALDAEAAERRKVLQGTYGKTPEIERFSKFVDEVYMKYAKEHKASWRHDEFRCETLKGFFKNKKFKEITPLLVTQYVNARLQTETIRKEALKTGEVVNKKRSPTTVNKEVTLLSSIFNMAIQEKLARENPCDRLPKAVRKKIPPRRKRNRFLTLEEEVRLYAQGLIGAREHLRDITQVAQLTGMRKGELFRLEPQHINFGRATIQIEVNGELWEVRPDWLLVEKTKTGVPRVIPMSGKVRSILKRLCDEMTVERFVFNSIRTGGAISDIKRGFKTACREAGIVNLTFHDLRHTWSTRAAECGVPGPVRRDILGHSSDTMTGDYTHST